MLNPDQMTAWEQDGFFVVENLLSAEETELLGRIARADVELRADASVRDDGEGRAVSLRVRNELTQDIYSTIARSRRIVGPMEELLGGEVEYIPKRPGEPDVTWAATEKIRSQLGWKPMVTFEEGVAAMLENIEYWREAPVWDTGSIEQATKTWFEAFAR